MLYLLRTKYMELNEMRRREEKFLLFQPFKTVFPFVTDNVAYSIRILRTTFTFPV